jgi:hypothetical protein
MWSVFVDVSADVLSETMNMMRVWLDERNISATTFRYHGNSDGAGTIVLDFQRQGDAHAFACAFDGRNC